MAKARKKPATVKVGAYVIVRSSPSGCWAGTLARRDGATVTLNGARRLWSWWAAEGVSLSGVAAEGLARSKDCRIASAVDQAVIYEACEVLTATAKARKSIESQPALSS